MRILCRLRGVCKRYRDAIDNYIPSAWKRAITSCDVDRAFREGCLFVVRQSYLAKVDYNFVRAFVRNSFADIDAYMMGAVGIDIDATDENGMTALMYSSDRAALCERKHLDRIKRLIAKGAKLDVKDNKGHTAIYMAFRPSYDDVDTAFPGCNGEAFRLLIDAGANLEFRYTDNGGMTLLHLAIYTIGVNPAEPDGFHLLLEKGVAFDVPDDVSMTALHHLASMSRVQGGSDDSRKCTNKWRDNIHELLSMGADISRTTIDRRNAFHFVRDKEIAHILLTHASSVGRLDLLNAKCAIGMTPLDRLVSDYTHIRDHEDTNAFLRKQKYTSTGRLMREFGATLCGFAECLQHVCPDDEFLTFLRSDIRD